MKQVIAIAIIIVVTVVIYQSCEPTEIRKTDATWIMGEIRGVGKFSVYQNTYSSDVIDSDKSEVLKKEFTDKFSTKRLILFYYATLKLGFDMEKVGINPDHENKRLLVSIPKIEVISHDVENTKEGIKIVSEDNGWWNNLKPSDQKKIIEEAKKKKEEEVLREVSQKKTEEFKKYLTNEISKFTTYEVVINSNINTNNQ